MTFIGMFKNRVMSKLFTQWKIKFLKKWMNNDLQQYHAMTIAQQSMHQWVKVGKTREQTAYEFFRTKQIQKFYTLFRKWNSANRSLVLNQVQKLRTFRRRIVFQVWVQYMEKQGHLL